MSSKIRIEYVSGSVLEGVLPTALAATFAYAELPTTIVVQQCTGAIERTANIQKIMEDNTITDDMIKGFVWADDKLWRDLVEILFGSSGLTDYDALMTANDTSGLGVQIYP